MIGLKNTLITFRKILENERNGFILCVVTILQFYLSLVLVNFKVGLAMCVYTRTFEDECSSDNFLLSCSEFSY